MWFSVVILVGKLDVFQRKSQQWVSIQVFAKLAISKFKISTSLSAAFRQRQ